MAGFRWGYVVVPLLAASIGWVFWQSLPSNQQMGLPPVGESQAEQDGADTGPGMALPEPAQPQPGEPDAMPDTAR